MRPTHRRFAIPMLLALLAALLPCAAWAQGDAAVVDEETAEEVVVGEGAVPGAADAESAAAGAAADAGAAAGALNYTLIELVQFGGYVGYVIILLSVVAVALIVDYALLLRPAVLMPRAEIGELRELVSAGRYDQITGDTRASFVGGVVAAGVAERSHGYEAVVKAMEDRADELTGRLLRRIEYLNMIANVAPMLGLLGTVIGMVRSFNQISVSVGGADPRLLAAGIFEALMTTVMGLIVAIPAFFAFSIFRNRVDALAADATATAEEVVAPLRPAERIEHPVHRAGRG